jgi:N-acetyl-anhydromuramyl-L-alanine amidase AmpD
VRNVQWLVVHTAGAFNPKTGKVVHQSVDAIREYHIRHNGWRDIGYHAYVENDGEIMPGRPENEIGAHAGGFNHHSLGLCVSGHGDHEKWNADQFIAVVTRLTQWCRMYRLPATAVLAHHETDEHGGPPVYKTCPGKLIDMGALRAAVAKRLETSA